MLQELCFLFALYFMIAVPDEIQEYKCKYDYSRYERSTDNRETAIGKAVKSATAVLTDNSFTRTIATASESLNSFKPVKDIMKNFVPTSKKYAKAIGDAAVVVKTKDKPETEDQEVLAPKMEMKNEKGEIDLMADRAMISGISDQQKQQLAKITGLGPLEQYLNTSDVMEKKFEKAAEQKIAKVKSVSDKEVEKFQKMSQQQQRQYNLSLRQMEQHEKLAQEEIKRFEKETIQQKKQYDLSLKNAKAVSNLKDKKMKQFIIMSEQQKKQYEVSQKTLKELQQLSKDQTKQFDKLSNQFAENSQQQIKQIKHVSGQLTSLAEDQAEEFKRLSMEQGRNFDQLSDQLETTSRQQLEGFKNLSDQQLILYMQHQQRVQELKQTHEQTLNQIGVLTQLISEGFKSLQKRMDERFDRIEEKLNKLTEITFLISYETDVQRKLREVHNAYLLFITHFENITNNEKLSDNSLNYLIKQCCRNEPFHIMATIYHKTSTKSLQTANMFQMIYNLYFTKDMTRMMNLYEFILDDVFKTLHYVTICDQVTNGLGLGVDQAVAQSIEIAKVLDQMTENIEADSLKQLHDETDVMTDVIKDWQKEGYGSEDLGCYNDKTDFSFASFAAKSLQKRFYFYTFFVSVSRANEMKHKFFHNLTKMDSKGSKHGLYRCIGNNLGHFIYNSSHSEKYNNESLFYYAEHVWITTMFIKISQDIDPTCLKNINVNCWNFKVVGEILKQRMTNGALCAVPRTKNHCGHSWSIFPHHVKDCEKARFFLTAACF